MSAEVLRKLRVLRLAAKVPSHIKPFPTVEEAREGAVCRFSVRTGKGRLNRNRSKTAYTLEYRQMYWS